MSYGSSPALAWSGRACDNGDGGETAGLQPQPQPAPASGRGSNGASVTNGRIIGTYRYIPIDQVEMYQERGWTLASGLNLNGTNHGEWARLMKEPD